MKPTLFAIDGEGPLYPGLWTGKTWNGWAVPLFPAETCIRIALEMLDDDGNSIFTYDEAADSWHQRILDCPEDGPWVEPAVMVDGVPHWRMGDGYIWERVTLDGGEIYSANGQPILRDAIPLPHQAAIIQAAQDGQSMGPLVVDGVTYDWS